MFLQEDPSSFLLNEWFCLVFYNKSLAKLKCIWKLPPFGHGLENQRDPFQLLLILGILLCTLSLLEKKWRRNAFSYILTYVYNLQQRSEIQIHFKVIEITCVREIHRNWYILQKCYVCDGDVFILGCISLTYMRKST